MSSGLTSISYYELYVRQSRGWELHARYADEGKDKATEEARVFEGTGKGVKIIRETYFPDRNTSTELVVYVSRNLSKAEAAFDKEAARQLKEEISGNVADRSGSDDDWGAPEMEELDFHFEEVGGKKKKKRKRKSSTASRSTTRAAKPNKKNKVPGITIADLMIRILAIALTGIVIGAVATGLSSMLLGQLPRFGIAVSQNLYISTLLGIFIVAFLFTVVPLAFRFVQLDELRRKGAVAAQAAEGVASPGAPPPAKSRFGFLFQQHKEHESEDDAGGLSFDFKYDDEPDPEEKEEAPKKDEEEPQDEEPPEEEPPEEEPPEEEPPEEDENGHKGITEGDRLAMTKFLGGVVTSIKGSRPQLDSYNKLGVLLLVAGATDIMGEKKCFNDKDRIKLLRETIEVMGTKPDLAKSFSNKLEEYFLEPRYMPMIQAGREAMTTFMEEGGDPFSDIKHVFELWNKPTGQSADQGVMTIMFTDMVGSTNLTQTKGDFGAQGVVRQHNQVVRTALNMHSGKEVKHTGDGIMASFSSAAAAVDACIDIQKMVAEQNAKSGSDSLRLRIGLNSGEPIQEENDLFGTTVQLAARICDKAGTDKILVSNVVRELSAGRSFSFVSRGAFILKGVNEPQTLYEVIWNNDGAETVAPPPTQPAPPAVTETPAAPPAPQAPAITPPPATEAVPAAPAPAQAPTPAQAQAQAQAPAPVDQGKPRPHLKQNPFSLK